MNETIRKIIITIGIFLVIIGLILLHHAYNNTSEEIKTYNFTSEEREIFAQLVHLEAGACGQECQRAVASVVLNRLEAGYWGDTIEEVIFYPKAFSPANLIGDWTPIDEAYAAVDYVVKNGSILPPLVRYFRDDYDHQWEGYAHYKTYDNIYFGYFTNGDF